MKRNALSEKFLIYLITAGTLNDSNFAEKKSALLEIVETSVETKIPLVQIREKNLSARFVFEIARESVKIAKKSATKILINDRADIALAAGASGVHLTSASLSAKIIRQKFPKNFIVGASAHSLEAAKKSRIDGADFVTLSPVFSSPRKGAPLGIEKLKAVCGELKPFPVVALGGIDETNWREVRQSGANGLAAIRFLNNAKNLRKLAEESS